MELGPVLQEVVGILIKNTIQSEQSLYRNVRTVFERINDTTIYFPEFQMAVV